MPASSRSRFSFSSFICMRPPSGSGVVFVAEAPGRRVRGILRPWRLAARLLRLPVLASLLDHRLDALAALLEVVAYLLELVRPLFVWIGHRVPLALVLGGRLALGLRSLLELRPEVLGLHGAAVVRVGLGLEL